MKGSSIAGEIIQDWKREKYYKRKAIREKCKDKQCSTCKYRDICEEYKKD